MKKIIFAFLLCAGCQSESEKQGFVQQDYTSPPPPAMEVGGPIQPSTVDVDMGGLIVSMPGQPKQSKSTKNVTAYASMTMYQSEVLKGFRGNDGAYLAGTADYSFTGNYVWNAEKALTGGVNGAFSAWKTQGHEYTTLSNKRVSIAGLSGQSLTGNVNSNGTTYAYKIIALVEPSVPRMYILITLTKDSTDYDAIQMLTSIRKK